MAEIKTQTRRILRGGRYQYFIEDEKLDIGFVLTNSSGLVQITLDEFDELVAFVNEHRKATEPTRAPEDFIREVDEAKDVS